MDEGEARLDEGDGGVRGRVGAGDDIGVAGLLAERTGRVPGEPDALVTEFLDGLGRDELGARFAGQVDEDGEHELDAVGADQFGEIRNIGKTGEIGAAVTMGPSLGCPLW